MMKQCRTGYLIAVFFLIPSLSAPGLLAQMPVHFDHLGREEGLSQSSVNCMIRDKDGFMWFGTQDGLNRYDGRKLRKFQNQPGDTASLSNNYILSVCEDEEGFLWIGTMAGGLNRFNKKTEQFRVFLHSEDRNSLSENTVWAVISTGDGTVWAGTSLGLNRYHKQKRTFTAFQHNPRDSSGIVSDMVMSLYRDSRGSIWAGTAEGLCRLDPETEKFTPFLNPADASMPGANIIWAVSETSAGKILTGTNNGIFMLDPLSGQFTLLYGMPGKEAVIAWSLMAEAGGRVWAGTAIGLVRLYPERNQWEVFTHDPADPQSIADNNVWCMASDPAGFLWAGTLNGISKTRYSATQFMLINDDIRQPVRLSSAKVMSVLEDRLGFLWVGTDGGGLNCISPGRKWSVVYNSANSGLRNNAVWALAEDESGNIWIGNYQGGLHVFRRSSGKIHPLPVGQNDPYALHNTRILTLLAGKAGEIWIGTRSGGLVRFDRNTLKFKNYLHSSADSNSISGNTVLSLAFDHKNRLWTGIYEGGLNMLIPGTDRFVSYRKEPGNNTGLSDDNVWSILFDKKGRLWLATQGGLNFSENAEDKLSFSYFGTQHGLNSNTIFGLLEDDSGNIWISSFNGLARLNIATFESSVDQVAPDNEFPLFHPLFRMFDAEQGLQGPEFNQGAYHHGRSGLLYFGGVKGLNFFSSAEVQESRFVAPVVITGMKIFNREVGILPGENSTRVDKVRILRKGNTWFLPSGITYIDKLVLTYRESVLSFEFAALDLSTPSKIRYAYKMEGFDKEWNHVGSQNIATYTNLSAGNYTFLVRGTNADGVWNTTPVALGITIVPPLWKTGWFIALLGILGFLMLWRAFLIQKRKAIREREITELQLKTIKSQIDPHFTFNALNTVASFIYEGQPDVTYDYFTRFAFMIRNILNDNDKISRSLQEEIDFVKNYLELQKIRFKDKFDYSVNMDTNISPDTQVPKMIIQTFAENAVKHGLMHRMKDGRLDIIVEKADTCLQIVIEDNGIGREKAVELNTGSTGKGLKIINQIIALYKKLYNTEITQEITDLSDENGNASGTRVILHICLMQEKGNKHHLFKKRNTGNDN